MPPGFPHGAASRRVSRYGEPVELVNEDLVADESSDWNDTTETETRIEAPMAIMPRQTASREALESGVEVEGDYVGYVAAVSLEDAVETGETDAEGDPVYEAFPIREGENATHVEAARRDYRVVRANENGAGVYEVLLA